MPESSIQFNKILEKVRKLIAKSESTDSPEEGDALRAHAEKLMLEYAIEQAMLDETRPAEQRIKPEQLNIYICPSDHKLAQYFIRLMATLASHCRVEVINLNMYGKFGNTVAFCVGYASDLRYLELLYTTLFLHMSGEIEPKVDAGKSFDENIYRLHAAGISWRRIVHIMCPEISKYDDPEIRKAGGRCKTAYRRWCKEIGEEPRVIVSPIGYQRNFCSAYVQRISNRLWAMREANDGLIGTAGSALVLRHESIKEMMDEHFPPETIKFTKNKDKGKFDLDAQYAGRLAGDRANLNTDSKVQSNDRELS